ncbi:MAG: hypothetical protein Q9218_003307, partial [Villophora microphyllina]
MQRARLIQLSRDELGMATPALSPGTDPRKPIEVALWEFEDLRGIRYHFILEEGVIMKLPLMQPLVEAMEEAGKGKAANKGKSADKEESPGLREDVNG